LIGMMLGVILSIVIFWIAAFLGGILT
jgi:hypothetical protein